MINIIQNPSQVTMVIGQPLPPPKWTPSEADLLPGAKPKVPEELINEYHATALQAMTELFDTYKAAAGYPDAVLEVV